MYLVDQFIRRSYLVIAACLVVFTACGGLNNQTDAIVDVVDVAVPLDGISQDMAVVDAREVTEDVIVDIQDISTDEMVSDIDAVSPIDVVTDADDVDACGICTGGKVCQDGQCKCPVSQEDCSGICKPLGTNTDCSICGDECPEGGSCQGGVCKCPVGEADCHGVCTELGTDDNCSRCDDTCVGVKTCEDGECTAQTDPDCVSTIMCVGDEDCGMGSRCNQAISPPTCQKLYCGSYGSVCYEDYFCLSQTCYGDACMNDCSGLECGPDPIYGESCGGCQEGATCKSNHCVCEPEDHRECVAGNVTWINSCGGVGTVVEGCTLACLNGACVDCVAVGKVNCSGTCKLLGTNTNCSECGDVCPVGGSCESGTCECPVDQADCSGTCTLMGTVSNCSGCGDVCTGGKLCQEGSCECPVGQADCSGTCKLLGTNSNCSVCGDACPTGGSCQDGVCECPVGQTDCFGLCKPIGTNTNCSDCGDECPTGGSCQDGVCECPVGQTDCFGLCTELGTDDNCSRCGDACAVLKICKDGECIAKPECLSTVYWQYGFEDGLTDWVLADPKMTDLVSWSVTDHRKAFGARSAYFGNAACFTYYSGALNTECDPVDPQGADSAAVRASIRSSYFQIPAINVAKATLIASAYIWVESEPMIPGIDDGVQPDQFRLSIVTKTAEVETAVQVISSVRVNKNTAGKFVYVNANISSFVGQEIAIRLSFDSIDGAYNNYEGVYVDEVKVFSVCSGQCDDGTECASDSVECSDDSCQVFLDRVDGKGACSYPLVATCGEPQCTTDNVVEKCITDEPCVDISCVEGECVFTELPEDECCRQNEILSAGFEDGTCSDFYLWTYLNEDVVKWRPSSFKSAEGGWSLYYGDPISRSYDTPGTFNFGEATSPSLELPTGNFVFLTFDLFLATEWDGGDAAAYYNPGGFDFFQVEVVERFGEATEAATVVWTSHNVQGTTGGVFMPVGVDLSSFAGKVVSVRFRFDTGNEEFNNFEGLYIDNVKVVTDSCDRKTCMTEQDCGIDGVCKTGSCTPANVCNIVIAGDDGCCSVTQDCDDGDECTADGCVNNVCLHDLIEMPGCCFEDVRADFTFDIFGDLDNFAVINNSMPAEGGVEVKWHLTETNSKSGTRSMYFGNDETGMFDNGGIARGTASSPEFSIPAYGDYVLSFSLFIDVQTDAFKDTLKVEVMDGLTPTGVFAKSSVTPAAYGAWFDVVGIDMNTWKGKTIKLRFTFDSVDAVSNNGVGVFVDSIVVERNCI